MDTNTVDTNTEPYAPAYPFPIPPNGLSGRLNASRRFHPERDTRRMETEVVAARIAGAACRAIAEYGRALDDDLADAIRALLVGDDVPTGVIA